VQPGIGVARESFDLWGAAADIRVAKGGAFFCVRDLADLSERDLRQLWRA